MKEPIKKFDDYVKEEFVAVGFGSPFSTASWSTPGRVGYNTSAYDLTPIAGSIPDLSMGIAQQAHQYETNDNAEHSGDGYVAEAKDHINKAIDEAYESKKIETSEGVDEAMVQIAGDKKPSGAKILAQEIAFALMDRGIIAPAKSKKDQQLVIATIQDVIINSTF